MFLTHKDVYLGYFKNKQKEIEQLKSRGYRTKEIKVNFIVYWKGEDMSEEIKIILPCVVFVKV